MGIVEGERLPRLLKIRKDLTQRFTHLSQMFLLVLMLPDFNITLEGSQNKRVENYPLCQSISMGLASKQVLKLVKTTDLVLAFLPFEKAFYDKYQVPCRFIGHTMADAIALHPDKKRS